MINAKKRDSFGLNFYWLLRDDLKARRNVMDLDFRFNEIEKVLICKLVRGGLKGQPFVIEKLVFKAHPSGGVARSIEFQIEVKGSSKDVWEIYDSFEIAS